MSGEGKGAAKASQSASGAAGRIVAAAQRLCAHRGYRGTSMDDIAQEAGLAKATLYLHFDGKDAIYRALIDRCRAEIAVRAAAAEQSDASLADRLTDLIYAYNGTALEVFGDVARLREVHKMVEASPAKFGSQGEEEEELERRLVVMLRRAADEGALAVGEPSESAPEIAKLLGDLARGAKVDGIQPAQYRNRLRRALSIIVGRLA